MADTIYIGVFKNDELIATMQWPEGEETNVEFIDNLHDMGLVVKAFTQEEYDATGWDELTREDIVNGNYYYETDTK